MSLDPIKSTSPDVFRALNTCIEACVNGEKGFALAAADVRSPELKELFLARSTQRASFVVALQRSFEALGSLPENQGTAFGALHRGFMGARSVVEGPDDAVIVAECRRGEAAALSAYDRALAGTPIDEMPAKIRTMILEQREAVKAAHDDLVRRMASPTVR